MVEKTKHGLARAVAENSGLDPDNPDYYSEGGTNTKKLLVDIAEAHGADVPDDATKEQVADIAVEAAGGDPERTRTSTGGTETKETWKELDRATSD
jgi:hypothetical protein